MVSRDLPFETIFFVVIICMSYLHQFIIFCWYTSNSGRVSIRDYCALFH